MNPVCTVMQHCRYSVPFLPFKGNIYRLLKQQHYVYGIRRADSSYEPAGFAGGVPWRRLN